MNETPFYKTRMGEKFYCKTVPELIRAVERLAAALDRLGNQANDDPQATHGE